jgi:hypothetical protein
VLLFLIAGSMPAMSADLVYEGTTGVGQGKHLVFIAGDHEYRSEESLPALARLLAKHHGFKCTVLFNIDPESGEIVAGTPSNIPNMEALDTADLAVVFLRFQDLPAEQMKHFDAYLKRGGPVVGLRTATHGFKIPADGEFAKYSFDSKVSGYELGFGHQVLGQTWVGHYGRNHQQSTRITIVDAMKSHPILAGVKDVWVQAGGYVGKPTDGDSADDGSTSICNGIFWAVGLEDKITPDMNVATVGPFKPNTFGNQTHARGIKPEMYAGFESPIPANNNTNNPAAKEKPKEATKAKKDKAKAKPDMKAEAAGLWRNDRPKCWPPESLLALFASNFPETNAF